jgi:hypothetical protein
MFKAMVKFIDDPKRVRPLTERVAYMYDLRKVILEEFDKLKQTPGVCEKPGTGETLWF